MDFSYNQSEPEIRAQILLLKAHMHKKASLNFEISQMKIKSNYLHSNADYRDLKDMGNFAKLLAKRLNEAKNLTRLVRSLQIKEISKEALADLVQVISVTETQLELPRSLYSFNFELDTYVDSLKEAYDTLSHEYDEKTQIFNYTQESIALNIELQSQLHQLEREIIDATAELELLDKENQALEIKKIKRSSKRRTSVNRVKNFHNLPESALKLHSKLLLRKELESSMQNVENELEDLTIKVAKEKERISLLQQEKEEDIKSIPKFELDLKELRKKIRTSEIKLSELKNERKKLGTKKVRSEVYDEETVTLTSVFDGYSQMKKQNLSLIEENLKLKDRISRLYTTKS